MPGTGQGNKKRSLRRGGQFKRLRKYFPLVEIALLVPLLQLGSLEESGTPFGATLEDYRFVVLLGRRLDDPRKIATAFTTLFGDSRPVGLGGGVNALVLFHPDSPLLPIKVYNTSKIGGGGGGEDRRESGRGVVAGDNDIHGEFCEEGGDPVWVEAGF